MKPRRHHRRLPRRPSDIYLAAWRAAEKELPPSALRLIEHHDQLHAAWRQAGFGAVPDELLQAAAAIDADPLARIPFALRQQTNAAAHEEWKQEQEPAALDTRLDTVQTVHQSSPKSTQVNADLPQPPATQPTLDVTP